MNWVSNISGRIGLSNVRRAMAVGIFVATMRMTNTILKRSYAYNNKSNLILSIVGACAAYIALKVNTITDNYRMFSIWTTLLAMRCILPDIPFGSVISMCISAAVLLPPYLYAPEKLDPTYYKFLRYHGGKSTKILDECRSRINGDIIKDNTLCPYIHPGETCINHAIEFFLTSLPRSFRLYFPLYIVLYIINPKRNIRTSFENMTRSSVFLSTYCTSAWTSACIYNCIDHSPISIFKFNRHAWTVGLASLIETQKRRTEIATYCLTYSLDSIFRNVEEEYVSPVDNSIVISIATGVLIYYKKIPFRKYLLI